MAEQGETFGGLRVVESLVVPPLAPWVVQAAYESEDRCVTCGRTEEEAEELCDCGLVAETEAGPWYCEECFPGFVH